MVLKKETRNKMFRLSKETMTHEDPTSFVLVFPLTCSLQNKEKKVPDLDPGGTAEAQRLQGLTVESFFVVQRCFFDQLTSI